MDASLERLTIRRYIQAMVFQGIWTAGQFLFPFVLAKSLAAPGWLVTVAVIMETTGMMLALYWGQLMDTGGRGRWLVWGGLGGRVVLVAALLVQTAGQFVVLLGIVYFFSAMVYPAQNSILQANLRPERHGQVFGLGSRVQLLTAAVTSLAVGAVLERDPDLFRWVYPTLGVLGFGYPLLLASLPGPVARVANEPGVFAVPRLPAGPIRWGRVLRTLASPFVETARTFRAAPDFRRYEDAFMIYGVAFMMLAPVVPLFFAHELNLSYQQITTARVLIASLGVGLLGPLAGRLMDRIKPARLCAISFGLMALFPVTLALGKYLLPGEPVGAAYLAFAVYSVGMAGINVAWNVGSISFAPPGLGGRYQAIHVALVGARGLLGPLIGFVILEFLGYREVFAGAALLFPKAMMFILVMILTV
ncbi:MAG: MFS transporter [Candidatus Krumholzibacteriia bacterium]